LGPHRAYWEPFCGSLAVLLAKPRTAHENVNDLHGELTNLAQVLAQEKNAVRLYGMLSRALMHESTYASSAAWLQEHELSDRPDVQRAYHYFIVAWQGRNGFEGTAKAKPTFTLRWTSSGGHNGQRFRAAVESIPDWHDRLRSVVILRRDGFDVLEQIEDNPRVVVYCDPPYLNKSTAYRHDFAADDHARLAQALRRFRKTRVVVSYYDDLKLAELYAGWTKVDCSRTKGLSSQTGAGATAAPEVLLINGVLADEAVTKELFRGA
ncbi:MAG: DNA adenine methylase, partial [Gemmataceae bacterium]